MNDALAKHEPYEFNLDMCWYTLDGTEHTFVGGHKDFLDEMIKAFTDMVKDFNDKFYLMLKSDALFPQESQDELAANREEGERICTLGERYLDDVRLARIDLSQVTQADKELVTERLTVIRDSHLTYCALNREFMNRVTEKFSLDDTAAILH